MKSCVNTSFNIVSTNLQAIFWSCIISMSIVMEGYDTTLLGSFFGYPSFRQKYGTYIDAKNGYQLSSEWQTGLNDIGAVGKYF